MSNCGKCPACIEREMLPDEDTNKGYLTPDELKAVETARRNLKCQIAVNDND